MKLKINNQSPFDMAINLAEGNIESLPEITQTTSLRPSALIERGFTRLEPSKQSDFLQTGLSLYTCYFMQAVAQYTTVVNGMRIQEVLNPLGTGGSTDHLWRIDRECLAEEPQLNLECQVKDAWDLEGFEAPVVEDTQQAIDEYETPFEVITGSDCLQEYDLESLKVEFEDKVSRPSNLAVGKIIQVPLRCGDDDKAKTVTMPIQVLLTPRVLDQELLRDVLIYARRDRSFMGRFHEYLAGDIESFTDYLFGLDLIEQERNILLRDKDGMYTSLKQKRAAANTGKVLTGKHHSNVASGIIYMLDSTARELETAMRGSLSKPRVREAFFKETGSMLLFVINPTLERFILYTRGTAESAGFDFKAIEDSGTGGGNMDLDSVFRAYTLGTAQRL